MMKDNYDLTVFGEIKNDNHLYGYHLWTNEYIKVGEEVTIVNENCEFDFDSATGTFEQTKYKHIVDLEIITADFSSYDNSKSNNGGSYAFADCRILKIHEKELFEWIYIWRNQK